MSDATDEVAERVFRIVAEQTLVNREKLTLDTTIEKDLKTTGDDAYELLLKLHQDLGIDFSTMRFERHFDPEVPQHSIAGAIWWVCGMALMVGSALMMDRIFGQLSPWTQFGIFIPFLVAWMWLARYRPDERRRRARKFPVTIRHLVEAARSKTWPFSYSEAPQ